MKAILWRDGDKVWLEGVTGWFVGDKESSVHAAQEAVMRAVGEDITYTELLGASGLAFRMQVSEEGLCPSSPHPFCGYPCVDGAVDALPWKIQVYEVDAEDTEAVAEARQAVMASIERGVPVQYGSEEDGIIVGYQKGGAEWLCFHPMHEGGTKRFVETDWPWGIAVYTEPKQTVPTRRELAVRALEQALDMSDLEQSEDGSYRLGFAAWVNYLDKLRALQDADEKARNDAMLGNSWIYECLAQYRRAAVEYLRDVAGLFAHDAAVHLRRAADLYEEMATEILCDREHCVVTIAPLPWALEEGQPWSDKTRAEQIRRLEAALPLEREALRQIGLALESGES